MQILGKTISLSVPQGHSSFLLSGNGVYTSDSNNQY